MNIRRVVFGSSDKNKTDGDHTAVFVHCPKCGTDQFLT